MNGRSTEQRHSSLKGRTILLFANRGYGIWFFRRRIVTMLRDLGARVVLVCNEDEYIGRLVNLGVPIVLFKSYLNTRNPLQLFRAMAEFHRIVRQHAPDIVHTFNIIPNMIGPVVARRSGVRGVISMITGRGYALSSDSPLGNLLGWTVARVMRFSLSNADLVVATNQDDRRLLEQRLHVPAARIVHIPGAGVDLDLFTPAAEQEKRRLLRALGLETDKRHILFVGRFLSSKGLDFLLRAFHRVADEDVRLLLIGEEDRNNPGHVDVHRIIGDETRVRVIGRIDNVTDYYRIADIVALPSEHEGMPTVLMEAAACGVPVVTTDVPGCREAVIPDETGLMVPYGDVDALHAALEKLLDDAPLRKDMGKKARAFAARFSRDKVVENTLDMYHDLLCEGDA